MSELRYWLWLSALTGVRPRVKQELIGRYGGARELFFSPIDELKGDGLLTEEEREALSARRLDAALNIIERCEQEGIGILTIQDAAYPRRLAAIYDPPLVLYVRGRLPSIDDLAAVAVVGTRRATPYGLKMATRIGYELTRCGALVVSGLTSGVDAAAAEGALMAGGSCVGVLGSAIDDRRWGGSLARDVETVGAVVSEYPPGTPGNAAFSAPATASPPASRWPAWWRRPRRRAARCSLPTRRSARGGRCSPCPRTRTRRRPPAPTPC